MNPTNEPARRRRRAPGPEPLGDGHQYDLDQEARIRDVLEDPPEPPVPSAGVPENGQLLSDVPATWEELCERLKRHDELSIEERVALEAVLLMWLRGEVIEKRDDADVGEGGPYRDFYGEKGIGRNPSPPLPLLITPLARLSDLASMVTQRRWSGCGGGCWTWG